MTIVQLSVDEAKVARIMVRARSGGGSCRPIWAVGERVFSLCGARHLREDTATSVDEPVADLSRHTASVEDRVVSQPDGS